MITEEVMLEVGDERDAGADRGRRDGEQKKRVECHEDYTGVANNSVTSDRL
jgi:hypothetical protein